MTAKKRDSNHAEIRDALRAAGCVVIDTANLGVGMVDMIAVKPDGTCFLIEVKSDGGRMTGAEVLFIVQLVNPAYRIFTSVEQAVEAVRDG